MVGAPARPRWRGCRVALKRWREMDEGSERFAAAMMQGCEGPAVPERRACAQRRAHVLRSLALYRHRQQERDISRMRHVADTGIMGVLLSVAGSSGWRRDQDCAGGAVGATLVRPEWVASSGSYGERA